MSVTVAPPYLPFMDRHSAGDPDGRPGSFRWRLGVRPLDLDDWIELGDDTDEALAEKRRLSTEHLDTVFCVLDDVEPESSEVATTLLAHLQRRWPERYGDVGLDPTLHPLDAAARLVPEDLVLLVVRDGRLVFGGGSVCFPNRWDLRSKLGLSMAEVHAPVAQLNAQLEAPIDRFFDRLRPDRSFWRLGWGIVDTTEWYLPPDGPAPRTPPAAPADYALRVERETLRRLPDTGVVLFTIRTYVTRLADVAAQPGVAVRLAGAVAELPHDVAEYKDLTEVRDALVDDLVARGRKSPRT